VTWLDDFLISKWPGSFTAPAPPLVFRVKGRGHVCTNNVNVIMAEAHISTVGVASRVTCSLFYWKLLLPNLAATALAWVKASSPASRGNPCRNAICPASAIVSFRSAHAVSSIRNGICPVGVILHENMSLANKTIPPQFTWSTRLTPRPKPGLQRLNPHVFGARQSRYSSDQWCNH